MRRWYRFSVGLANLNQSLVTDPLDPPEGSDRIRACRACRATAPLSQDQRGGGFQTKCVCRTAAEWPLSGGSAPPGADTEIVERDLWSYRLSRQEAFRRGPLRKPGRAAPFGHRAHRQRTDASASRAVVRCVLMLCCRAAAPRLQPGESIALRWLRGRCSRANQGPGGPWMIDSWIWIQTTFPKEAPGTATRTQHPRPPAWGVGTSHSAERTYYRGESPGVSP